MQQLAEYGSSDSSCNEGFIHFEIKGELLRPNINTWQVDTLPKFVILKWRYDRGQFREACGRRVTWTKHR